MDSLNGHTPREVCRIVTESGIIKAHLSWPDLIIKSFLGGIFISLGALFNLITLSGSPGLRASNPTLISMVASFLFPTGFFLIVFTNVELATSNMFTMMFTTLQRRTTWWDLIKNWVVSYIFNMAGALFFAGFLAYWTDTLSTPTEKDYAAFQAEARVNISSYWSRNFLRGVGCNYLVGLTAYTSSAASNEHVAKIYSLWIPVWAFATLGYQHCIANYFLVPIGMFYGADFSTGEFIYKNCVPVTLGNVVGGAGLMGVVFWWLYGRDEDVHDKVNGDRKNVEGFHDGGLGSGETVAAVESSSRDRMREPYASNVRGDIV
jgi:formate/nitrite transporter